MTSFRRCVVLSRAKRRRRISTLNPAVAIVAEDSKVARQLLEQGLKSMGIPAIMHNTGLEAWIKISEMQKEAQANGESIHDKIALVLTDLEMPEMDGFTLTRNIKRDDALRQIPVVIHSSLSGSANEDHVRKVGADGYVAKFEINELSSVIYRVLEKSAKRLPRLSLRRDVRALFARSPVIRCISVTTYLSCLTDLLIV